MKPLLVHEARINVRRDMFEPVRRYILVHSYDTLRHFFQS